MNLFYKIIRLTFFVFAMASFVVFIAAAGAFGGIKMPELLIYSAGAVVGCSWIVFISNAVLSYTGVE